MTYLGRVKDGVIVLEGNLALPEGVDVRVEVVEMVTRPFTQPSEPIESLGDRLLKYAGKAVGLPADASRNHDHYLYHAPKK